MACVLAASAMPTAYAEKGEPANSKAYEIKLDGAVMPAGLELIEYPYRAASAGRDGACDLSVQVDERGNIGAVMVDSCTSSYFRAEAAKLATANSGLDRVAEVKPLHIEWSID